MARTALLLCFGLILYVAIANGARVKRQEDDSDGPDQSPEELCTDRPADEYFRLSTEGDCRDVVSLKYEEKR